MNETFSEYKITHRADDNISFTGFVSDYDDFGPGSGSFVVYREPTRDIDPVLYVYDAKDWSIEKVKPDFGKIIANLREGSLIKDDSHVPFFKTADGWLHANNRDLLNNQFVTALFEESSTFEILYEFPKEEI